MLALQARKLAAVHAANSRELQSYEHKQQQLEVDIAQVCAGRARLEPTLPRRSKCRELAQRTGASLALPASADQLARSAPLLPARRRVR
jgi:hypothetical protein